MAKLIKRTKFIIMLFIIIAAFGCKPDPLEYARPDNLAGTIYLQLESLGTFDNYLKAIDQSIYKESLTKGGSWTVFAPTDEAFEKYMSAKGYSNFDAIPKQVLDNIIQYSIVVDGWNTTTLTYFKNRFYLGQSFRRRTQYQAPYREVDTDTLQHIREIDVEAPGKYLVNWSNGRQKTVSYFLDSYLDTWSVTNEDYEWMFPDSSREVGDMHVYGANVSQTNIVAENGIIYALDEVLEPRGNLYENLSLPEYGGKYSMFKKIIERFATLGFPSEVVNEETGDIETVYQLRFATGLENDFLPFNPFDENYPTNIDGTLAQSWGMLAPTNEALTSYLDGNSILGQFYDSYDDMPLDVLGKFVSPFFFSDYWDICPSRFGQSFDTSLGFVDVKPEDFVDRKYCGNGFFGGVNKVYTNNSFGTIMGPLLLDPEYYIMLRSIQNLGIDTGLQSNGVRFTILGIKNDQFVNVADPNSATRRITVLTDPEYFDPEDPTAKPIYMQVEGDPNEANNRIYPDPNTSSPSNADITYVTNTLNDIVLNQIIDGEVDFTSNNYYQARSGEFIYAFNGNSAAGGGDLEVGQSAQIVETEETINGNFYEMSSVLNIPSNFTFGTLANNESNFSSFVQVLESADALINIVGTEDKLLNFLNLQRTFTLFAPNNTAVAQAIADGVIPDPDPLFLDTLTAVEFAQAKKDLLDFATKHFIQQALPTDGITSGTFSSMYFSEIVDFAPVYDEFTVVNTTSSISITNEETGESVTTSGITNLLSKRVVIHEIDTYIK